MSLDNLTWMRKNGWVVACHNDYTQNGKPMTFWGFSKGNLWVRGEGRTDEAALLQAKNAAKNVTAAEAVTSRVDYANYTSSRLAKPDAGV